MNASIFYRQIFTSTWWFILLCTALPSFSQTIITGKVTNQKNEGVSDISVMLMLPTDSTIIDYSFSDTNGHYKLSCTDSHPHLFVTISALGIKVQSKHIENKSQTVNFTTEEGNIILREVVVKGAKIWGQKDTLNYSVEAFKDIKDVVIGDVLKKMPGIEVKESGQISYNGKPINKFYIENLDMLQGRYGIATNNISVNDIKTIQVLENHQPIKALDKSVFTNEAAINLKIKDGKKGVFSMMAMLGLGFDKKTLWQEELTGMYFAKKRQHLFSYKTNNNGTDLGKELQSFTGFNPIRELQLTDVQQPSYPSIRFERYNFNTTHAVTVNNLFKFKNDGELNANLIYSSNKDNRHSLSRTSYVLPGENIKIIEEDISIQNKTNNLDTEIRYHLNKDRKYFNNNLKLSGTWDNVSGVVNMDQLIEQQLNNKSFRANNITHWIQRGENERGIEVLLHNAFRSQPHSLYITPGLYPNLINDSIEYAALLQNVRYNAFASNNKFSFLSAVVVGNVRINPTATVNIEYQTLQSNMNIRDNSHILQPITSVEMQNDIHWTRINTGISIDGSYENNRLKILLALPVMYRYTSMNYQNTNDNKINVGKFFFQPSLFAKYNFTSRLEANLEVGFHAQTPGLTSLYTGYILQNYRTINRYNAQLFDSKNLYSSLNLSYRNILNIFFIGGGILFNRNSKEGLYAQSFDGLLSVTEIVMQPNDGYSLSVNGRISKGLNWKGLVISGDASWGKSTSEQMRQSTFVTYSTQWINTNATITLKPLQWLLTEYKVSWGRSQAKVSSGEKFKAMQSLTNFVKMDVLLPLNISLNGSFEHYYNSVIQGDKNFILADIGLSYTHKGVRYSLDCTNMLNTKKYISASYGGLNSYYSEYDIRSLAVMFKVRFKLF